MGMGPWSRYLMVILLAATAVKDVNAAALGRATYIFMNVQRGGVNGESMEECANFYPNLAKMRGAIPVARSLEKAKPYTLAYFDEEDDTFCSWPPASRSFAGDIIHSYLHFDNWSDASGGTCDDEPSITDRILKLQEYNASAVLFVTTPDETHVSYYDPRVNGSLVSIPIYYINKQAQDRFAKFVGTNRSKASLYKLRFYVPKDPPVDLGMVVILIIAVVCVAIGGLWSGYRHYELYLYEASKRATVSESSAVSRQTIDRREENANPESGEAAKTNLVRAETSQSSNTEPAAAPFSWLTLIVFIVIIVGFLLLLYFLYPVVVWLVIVIYVIASSSAMCECLYFFVEKIPYGKCAFRLDPLADCLSRICRCCKWKIFRVSVEYRHAILYFICVSVAILWCVFRHWSYSFVLHDILAIFFSIVTIRNLRIPNLMWITSLLSMLLIYDLFMVFITPYMTPSGCSVMIDVATGGACSKNTDVQDATHNLPPSAATPKEELPIVIRVPRFNEPLWSCYRMEVDLQYPPVILGLGDIILPGILVGYNAAYSLAAKTPYRLYYVFGVIGYLLGMIATFVALVMTEMAQPALIYLVPFTLVPTHIMALARKEWKKMWKGQFPLLEESCPILKQDGSERPAQSSPDDQRARIHAEDSSVPAARS